MFDLIVTGGMAVMPAAAEAADIGVAGGKIAAIGAPGTWRGRAARDGRCGRADRHSRRGRSAHPLRSPIPSPGRNEEC